MSFLTGTLFLSLPWGAGKGRPLKEPSGGEKCVTIFSWSRSSPSFSSPSLWFSPSGTLSVVFLFSHRAMALYLLGVRRRQQEEESKGENRRRSERPSGRKRPKHYRSLSFPNTNNWNDPNIGLQLHYPVNFSFQCPDNERWIQGWFQLCFGKERAVFHGLSFASLNGSLLEDNMICPLMLLSSDQDLIIERKEAKERQIHETMLASFPLFVANINCFRDLPSGPKGLLFL